MAATAVAIAAGALSLLAAGPAAAAETTDPSLPEPQAVDPSVVAPVVVPLSDCSDAEVMLPVVDAITWFRMGEAMPLDPTVPQRMDPRTDQVFRAVLVGGTTFVGGGDEAQWLVGPGSDDVDTGCAPVEAMPPAGTPTATSTMQPSMQPTGTTEEDDPAMGLPVGTTPSPSAAQSSTSSAESSSNASPTVQTRVLSESLVRPGSVATAPAQQVGVGAPATQLARTGPQDDLALAGLAGLLIVSGAAALRLGAERPAPGGRARH